jgi:hypothetical protein
MSEHTESTGMNRRTLIAGLGAVGGAAGLAAAALPSSAAASSGPSRLPMAAPQAITPPIPGLTYLAVDGLGFHSSNEGGREHNIDFGIRSLVPPTYAYAPLLLPVGSHLMQLNVTYRGSVIAYIDRRQDTAPYWESLFNTGSTPHSATPTSESYTIDIQVEHGKSYILRFYAEDPILPQFETGYLGNMTLGYVPPPSGFMPYTGTTPRILDTRQGGGKVLAGDAGARTLDLGMAGAKAVVINLTADSTEAYGYFSVFPADVAWPGNSSLNWTAANVTIANTVIAPLSPDGKIKLRAGESAAHAIVDVQGFLF